MSAKDDSRKPKIEEGIKGAGAVRPRHSLLPTYLQPGVSTVCPGGWHFAPGSFGPLLLLPGPKSGSANAAPAPPNDIVSAKRAAMINIVMRLRIRVSLLPSSLVCAGSYRIPGSI